MGSTELALGIGQDEDLGVKICHPQSPDTIQAINKVVASFTEKVGPQTGKFAQLFILEEKLAYPRYTQEKIDETMSAYCDVLQETADNDPFGIMVFADLTMNLRLKRMIDNEEFNGKVCGTDKDKNIKLKHLYQVQDFVDSVVTEIGAKFPQRFRELREKQLISKLS